MDLTGLILLLTFTKIILFGRKPIKIASVFGFLAGLISIFYTLAVLLNMDIPMYSSLVINILLSISLGGFWYISRKKPDYFFPGHNPKKDTN